MPALPLHSNATLRAVEAALVGDAGLDLMARAGQAAWRAVLKHWPQAQRLLIICGPGNNGGDGYLLAAHAHMSGRTVNVLRLPNHYPVTAQAQAACAVYERAGGAIVDFDGALPEADVLVDALFGIGLARAPDAAAARLIAAMNAHAADVLSIDVPSGVDAERGGVPGVAVQATRTLQCLAAHPGLHTGVGRSHAGQRMLASLGVADTAFVNHAPVAWLDDGVDTAVRLLPPRLRHAHKGHQGHVLCIGGNDGFSGALLLAGEAALRCGSGLVSLATQRATVSAALAHRPEWMAHACDGAAALQRLAAHATVLLVGPGLGRTPWSQDLFDATRDWHMPCVVDADALNLLARRKRAWPQAVLTPHPGEAARLLGSTVRAVEADRYGAVRALADGFDAAVVLKGAGTLVTAPDHPIHVIAGGNPGMASGGMGDVLSGVIAALLAQGLETFDAACLGASLHARAGDHAAAERGERGLLASDLFAHLQRAVNPILPRAD